MENAVFGGYYWSSDGLVAELHRIRHFFGLGVLWYNPLAPIMIEVYPYSPSLFSSKVPCIAIGYIPVNHDWKAKGSNRCGIIVKWDLGVFLALDLRVKGCLT